MLFGVLFSSKSSITKNLYTTVDQLKQAIVEEWNKLSQHFIDRSIDEWRRGVVVLLGLYSSRMDTLST